MRLIDADDYKKRYKDIIDCEIDHPKYQDTLKELIDSMPTINSIKTELNGDLISRQAVKDLIRGLTKWSVKSQDRKFENVGLLYDDVMFGIDRLPSAEKTAEWIIKPKVLYLDSEKELYNWNDVFEYECSDCGYVYIAEKDCEKNYCPNCGAKMKVVE